MAGRHKKDNAKHKIFNIRVTDEEFAEIEEVAEKLKITKTEAVLRGIKLLKNPPKQEVYYRNQLPNYKPKKIPKHSEGIIEGETKMF